MKIKAYPQLLLKRLLKRFDSIHMIHLDTQAITD